MNNPLTNFTNFRLLVIYHLKSLKELDGQKVELEERANAIRVNKDLQDIEVSEQGIIKSPTSSSSNSKSIGSVLTKLEIAVSYVQVKMFGSHHLTSVRFTGYYLICFPPNANHR